MGTTHWPEQVAKLKQGYLFQYTRAINSIVLLSLSIRVPAWPRLAPVHLFDEQAVLRFKEDRQAFAFQYVNAAKDFGER